MSQEVTALAKMQFSPRPQRSTALPPHRPAAEQLYNVPGRRLDAFVIVSNLQRNRVDLPSYMSGFGMCFAAVPVWLDGR